MLQRIGRYEILERIAAGGQGTVYRAKDTILDRVVAVKVINQPLPNGMPPPEPPIGSHCLVDYHPFNATTRPIVQTESGGVSMNRNGENS